MKLDESESIERHTGVQITSPPPPISLVPNEKPNLPHKRLIQMGIYPHKECQSSTFITGLIRGPGSSHLSTRPPDTIDTSGYHSGLSLWAFITAPELKGQL